MIFKNHFMKRTKLFIPFFAAIVLVAGPNAYAAGPEPASLTPATTAKPEPLEYASGFYGIPEEMLHSMPSSESEALLSLTNLELWKKRQLNSRIGQYNNLSKTYYIQFLRDSQGNFFTTQKDEADYANWKEAEDSAAAVKSSSPSGWLKVTMAIADIDLLYEQLSVSCQWLEKPDVDVFEESITFSWKNGFCPSDSSQEEYSIYGYIEGDEWYLEELPFKEDPALLDECRTLTFSKESGKENVRRTEETIFASINVRKNFRAEMEQLSLDYEILPKGTLHNLRASISRSQTPLRTLGQNITSIFGISPEDWRAKWHGIIKRGYTDRSSEAAFESKREKFIYNTYEIVLGREPVLDELNSAATKIRIAAMPISNMNRYDLIDKYGSEMLTTEFITMLFSSDEFKQRRLSTEELLTAILAATAQNGYGSFSKDEWLGKLNDGMAIQDALSICYDTYDFMNYCYKYKVYCDR